MGGGGTLIAFIQAFRDFERTQGRVDEPFHIFAFDGFQGLPESTSSRDLHPGWKRGAFAHTLDEVQRRIASEQGSGERLPIRFVAGFFEQTLTEELRGELLRHPPSIVMIDVDYYSSTRTVLEWLRPILRNGTVFYFDDVWGYGGDPEKGELAAIREFNHGGKGRLVNYPVEPGMRLVSPRYVFVQDDTGSSPPA